MMNYKFNCKNVSILISAALLLFFVMLAVGYYNAQKDSSKLSGSEGSSEVVVLDKPDNSLNNSFFLKFSFRKKTHFDEPKELPEVSFLNPEGKRVSWGDFKGKYTLVNIWATWCSPCVVELPTLQRLGEIFKDRNLNVIAVSVDFSFNQERLKAFLDKRNVNDFALYFDKDMSIQRNIPLSGVPTTFLLNPEGKLLYIFEGNGNWSAPPAVDFFDRLLKQNY